VDELAEEALLDVPVDVAEDTPVEAGAVVKVTPYIPLNANSK
jgi:hypothetical protein